MRERNRHNKRVESSGRSPRVTTRIGRFQRKYNWTAEAYQEMYDAQDGKCAICRAPIHNHLEEDGKISTAIDHCHKTGVVRGLLCKPCNCAIGYMEDDPERLERAAAYVMT